MVGLKMDWLKSFLCLMWQADVHRAGIYEKQGHSGTCMNEWYLWEWAETCISRWELQAIHIDDEVALQEKSAPFITKLDMNEAQGSESWRRRSGRSWAADCCPTPAKWATRERTTQRLGYSYASQSRKRIESYYFTSTLWTFHKYLVWSTLT